VITALVVLAAMLVALYTANYARWAWRRRMRLGATGLVLLALASVAVPVWLLWYLS